MPWEKQHIRTEVSGSALQDTCIFFAINFIVNWIFFFLNIFHLLLIRHTFFVFNFLFYYCLFRYENWCMYFELDVFIHLKNFFLTLGHTFYVLTKDIYYMVVDFSLYSTYQGSTGYL